MAHKSENSNKLICRTSTIYHLSELSNIIDGKDRVYLLWFPVERFDQRVSTSERGFAELFVQLKSIGEQSTVCILTTPPDAVRIQLYFDPILQFQLWIAIKKSDTAELSSGTLLRQKHLALLILTKYHGSLKHTKTRIAYSYCPACGKTTKDYGGKKHVYNEYGTLMSDVWRDIEVDATKGIERITDRLSDLFGLSPYKELHIINLSRCAELLSQSPDNVKEQMFLFSTKISKIPEKSRLICGDCVEELKSISTNSIDYCFADPPYNLEKKYDGYNDTLELIQYFKWCDLWLSELARVLKPGGTLSILNIPLWAIRHYKHLVSILNYQAWIAWEALSLPVRMIMPSHYTILCFSKGEPRTQPGLTNTKNSILESKNLKQLAEFYCLRSNCVSSRARKKINDKIELTDLWYDIHRLKHNSRRVDHPTQLPPILMRRLFSVFTNPGEIILDCFNGSGTSTLVAQQMGRSFIGIEISDKYHHIALMRHNDLSLGKDPFGKNNKVPTAKNTRVRRLPKQNYKISKKTLQLEVKRIAQLLNKIPTRDEVQYHGKFPIEYYDKYFLNWGEVCAAARTTGMSELPPDKDLETVQSILFHEN